MAMALALIAALVPELTLADDTGVEIEAAVEKKVNKKTSLEMGVEFRSRNHWRTADRVAMGLSASHKLTRWLKADIGYQLLIDNNIEKITYHTDGSYNNWRPSYGGTRHRFYTSLSASYKWRRVNFSLRERYRFTYRPEKTTTRYDFDNGYWEDTDVRSSYQHMLRSRFKVEWDIPRCKISPFASVELFNDMRLDKSRLQVGAEYSLLKAHSFELYYQYQHANNDEEDEGNTHHVGVSYKFKF